MKPSISFEYEKGDQVNILHNNVSGHGIAPTPKAEWKIIKFDGNWWRIRSGKSKEWSVHQSEIEPAYQSRLDQANFIQQTVIPFLTNYLEEQTSIADRLREFPTKEAEIKEILSRVVKSGGAEDKVEEVLIEFDLIKPPIKQSDLEPAPEDDRFHPRTDRITINRPSPTRRNVPSGLSTQWMSQAMVERAAGLVPESPMEFRMPEDVTDD